MLAIVVAVLTLLVTLGPNLNVHWTDGPFGFYDGYGNPRVESSAVFCAVGHMPTLALSRSGVTLPVLAHELAHAYDCLDNGVMDGSPATRPSIRPQWASDYCWDRDAEWYACNVGRFGLTNIEPSASSER